MNTDNYASDADTQELIRIGKLPTALALAEHLEKTMQWPLHGKAADELRRLHALNAEMLFNLKVIVSHADGDERLHARLHLDEAQALIDKAEGGAA